ncbi:OLC1v1010787C1 [Oldenlandia corymbosa var. corymbosa]|uniref:OLC1v1010787C1 n=1 Tax=Oldenlandia corymbosa var. corymbosa TaxID=529605 RepID=A0AAV1DVD1_OLDCO|nr:OLC1v1010787C1 [Oldenlandia corymbosa var. corymbosa]
MADNNTVTRQQKITLQNRHGEKLVGAFHDTGSVDVVILCHGFRSSKEYRIMVNISDALENKGISSFRFDSAGNGESEGSFEFGNYWGEVEDLRSVVEYFTPGMNRNIAAIVGHSRGGMVALLYASKYHDISAVISIASRFKSHGNFANTTNQMMKDLLEKIKKEGYTEESLMEELNINMHDPCLQIDKDCRVLTVHGSADDIVPVDDAMEYAKVIRNHTLRIIEGAGHGFNQQQDELVSAVLSFIEQGQLAS